MTAATNYCVNTFLVDKILRGTATTIPTSLYYALFVANKGYWTASTVYAAGDTILPATPNGHIYKTTAGGTSGTNAGVFTGATTPGQSVTDNTVTWIEQTTNILAGTFPPEASYTGYARVVQASSLADWAGTQGAGTVVASTGSSGQTSNNLTVTFGAPTSSQGGVVAGMFLADAITAGNILFWSMLTNPKTINNGDAAPNFPPAAFQLTWS